jgi:hypothetical protein
MCRRGGSSIERAMLPPFLYSLRLENLDLSLGTVDLLFERHPLDVSVTVMRRHGRLRGPRGEVIGGVRQPPKRARLDVSTATVERHCTVAGAWLHQWLSLS